MKKNKICKILKIDYGHRVMGHENKCATVHGHLGVIHVHACSDDLDSVGRVIDFSVIKEKVGGWLDTYWDHAFIANKDDRQLIANITVIPGQFKPIFELPSNPTAENLASYLLHEVCPLLMAGTGVTIYKIEFWETATSCGIAELG
jgi:6-pyruvoyltetrahydropterin/6-carboxytetrahydropterin synthase